MFMNHEIEMAIYQSACDLNVPKNAKKKSAAKLSKKIRNVVTRL